MSILFFILILFFLFLLSRQLTKLMSRLFLQIFHNQTISIHLLSFIFLPGVILHEMSHLLVANILLVPTGEVEFFPEIRGTEVKMGSVAVAQTDPLRRFLIGVAPLLGGLLIMVLSATYLLSSLFSWQSLLLFYIIFEVANTMFSSGKDMEGALGFLVAMIVVVILLQIIGLPIWQELVVFSENSFVSAMFARMNLFLFLALGLDIFFALLLEGIARLH